MSQTVDSSEMARREELIGYGFNGFNFLLRSTRCGAVRRTFCRPSATTTMTCGSGSVDAADT